MDLVLGVAMTPTHVRMVLAEAPAADGCLVDHDAFGVDDVDPAEMVSAAELVVDAILGTREGAIGQGHRLVGTAIAYSYDCEATALRAALEGNQLSDVILVDHSRAAAALAVAVGRRKALSAVGILLLDVGIASIVVVDVTSASIIHVVTEERPTDDPTAVIPTLVAETASLPTPPEELVLVGAAADIAAARVRLRELTAAVVCAPEESELALARGAALAYVGSSAADDPTAGLAYSQQGGIAADADATDDSDPDDTMFGDLPTTSNIPMVTPGSALTAVAIAGAMVLGITLAAGVSPAADQHAAQPVAAAPSRIAAPIPQEQKPRPLGAPASSVAHPVPPVDINSGGANEQVAAPRLVAAAQPQQSTVAVVTTPAPTAVPVIPTIASVAPVVAPPVSSAPVELAQPATEPAPTADEFAPSTSQTSAAPGLGGEGLWPSTQALPPWVLLSLLPRWLAPPPRSVTRWTPQSNVPSVQPPWPQSAGNARYPASTIGQYPSYPDGAEQQSPAPAWTWTYSP